MDFRAVKVLALIVLLSGAALAQDALTGLPSLDPSKLGADVFSLGGVVLLVVQFLKRQVERTRPDVRPWVWWAVSVTLAEAGAAGLFYARFGATFGDLPSPWGWLLFGLLAGLVASGFKDLVMGILKTPRPSTAPDVNVKVEAPAALPTPAPLNVTIKRPASGLEPIPGLDAPAVPRGFLDDLQIPDALMGVILMALKGAGVPDTVANAGVIVARLLPVAPDLLDGSAHLSSENRNRILNEAMTLKSGTWL